MNPMLVKNKDKIVGAIIAKMSPKKEEEEESKPAEEENDYELAAEEILLAVKHRDVPGLVEALKYFIKACGEEEVE